MNRTFQVSSDLFWGYKSVLDVSVYETLDDICKHIQQQMKQFFVSHNLLALAEKVDSVKLHIHSPIQTIEDIYLHTSHDTIIYVCDHCL